MSILASFAHPWPKFMGGPIKQDLARLHESLHQTLHRELAGAFKEAGLLRIGGRGGGKKDWAKYFAQNPGKRDEALTILRRVTQEFDKKNGTQIGKVLDGALTKAEAPPITPPK